MFKKRRGLSAIIGGVFMLIVITTAITYTTFNMNQITQLAETISIKQTSDVQKSTEKFELVKVSIDNNQFNMTVKNTGNIPVHLNRLWIENTTDSSWPVSRFDISYSLAPGNTTMNIGQNIGLTALDTQSYAAQLVTTRGTAEQVFLNTVGDSTIYLRLTASPSVLPTTFSTNVALEVINTGTTQLLNLQPTMLEVLPTCSSSCNYVLEQSVTPVSFDSVDPGDTAIFEWVYSFTGSNGDTLDFTAGLVNDLRNDTVSISLQTIQSSLNAEVAIESGGLGNQVLIDDSILLFHEETEGTPSGEYQMWSGVGDGGGDGDRISLDAEIPHFFTNNGSEPITIPAGDWNIALMLSSEPVATGLLDQNEDMIFHFEDGVGANPDNSEGDSSRDLESCGSSDFGPRAIQASADDAEQDGGGSMDLGGGSSDHELVYDGGNHQWMGYRWDVDIPKGGVGGVIVTSAYIEFEADEADNTTPVAIIIGAQDTDDATAFTTASDNVKDRWDGTIDSVTTAQVAWAPPVWGNNDRGTNTQTPDLSAIIQEIIDRPGWNSGQGMAFIITDNSGGSNNNHRTAKHWDNDGQVNSAHLYISWGAADASPTYREGLGPHNSGTYEFDGTNDCFRSSNDVSDGDGNHIDNNDVSTSLWFKTDSGEITTEEMLVFWEGDGVYPLADYYKISLGEDGTGKILFEYNMDQGLTADVTCRSQNEYDDGEWYHIVATRDGGGDECRLYIKDIDGVATENTIFTNANHPSYSVVDADGKWYVGSNQETLNYFGGWIDDVMHWNEDELSGSEADDLGRTNYGDDAYRFDLDLDLTDASGTLVENWYTEDDVGVFFADPKNGGNNDDWAYSQVNMTFTLPQKVVGDDQRLELYFEWIDSTATLESLEVDMKIDDTSMTNPYPSFMQIPFPSDPFPTYYTHDNDDHFDVIAANTGTDGIFLIYQGTRINFNGTGGAYAALVDSINGTAVHEDRDSLYIPPGQVADLDFYVATDIPSTNAFGNKITPGSYRTTIWLNGYSDQGETFSRSVPIGSIIVTD